MLLQMHYQFEDGHTEFVSQHESDFDNNQWIEETMKTYSIPEGAIWAVGNEEWEHFLWMKQ